METTTEMKWNEIHLNTNKIKFNLKSKTEIKLNINSNIYNIILI